MRAHQEPAREREKKKEKTESVWQSIKSPHEDPHPVRYSDSAAVAEAACPEGSLQDSDCLDCWYSDYSFPDSDSPACSLPEHLDWLYSDSCSESCLDLFPAWHHSDSSCSALFRALSRSDCSDSFPNQELLADFAFPARSTVPAYPHRELAPDSPFQVFRLGVRPIPPHFRPRYHQPRRLAPRPTFRRKKLLLIKEFFSYLTLPPIDKTLPCCGALGSVSVEGRNETIRRMP